MEKNVGGIDRVVRIVAGLGLLSLFFLLGGRQPLVGVGRARSACDRCAGLVPGLPAVRHQDLQDGVTAAAPRTRRPLASRRRGLRVAGAGRRARAGIAGGGAGERRCAAGVGPTLEVVVRDFAQTFAAEGVVEAVKQTTLGAQVAGRIVELNVKAGDTVRAGQVLARIDARTADQAVAASLSQVAEAEANLANARRKHERNRDLLAQKFVSQAAVGPVRSRVQGGAGAARGGEGQRRAGDCRAVVQHDQRAVRRRRRRDARRAGRHGAAGPAARHGVRSARPARDGDAVADGAAHD